jgi:hypothetical protein
MTEVIVAVQHDLRTIYVGDAAILTPDVDPYDSVGLAKANVKLLGRALPCDARPGLGIRPATNQLSLGVHLGRN